MRYERASGRRRMRIGEGMVTAVRAVTITYPNGTVERLISGCTNLAVDHELVRQRPELFRMVLKDDRTGVPRRHRDQLRAALRNEERTLERTRRLP